MRVRSRDVYTAHALSEATLPAIMKDGDVEARTEDGRLVSLTLRTTRGVEQAKVGDWIVRCDVTGQREALSAETFSKRFEPA
jgi:hypothetical protein